LFAVYLDDFSNELNNIKDGCYTGEALLNHLMFADDICVFCPSVRWLQKILDGILRKFSPTFRYIFVRRIFHEDQKKVFSLSHRAQNFGEKSHFQTYFIQSYLKV